MGSTLAPDVYRDWAQGVVTSLRAEEIPANASPRGLNSALVSVGGGRCTVGKRRGAELVNTATVVDGLLAPVEIRGLTAFYHSTGDTLYRLFTTKDGQLRRLNDDGTHTSIDATFLTADAETPIWATLGDRLFVANGTDRQKVIVKAGTLTPQNVSIVRPIVGTFAGAAGAAGTPNGTYELVVTYENTDTGHVSSRSDVAAANVVLALQRLNVTNVPVSPDAQVTARNIYVRNIATQTAFYLVHTISDNVTTSVTGINWTDANLITPSPDTAQNDPIPNTVAIRGWVAHGQRLFGWDDQNLYYSALGKPESFDPENIEPVKPQDGQRIVKCVEIDDNTLIIYKERSVYGLFGDDPNEWYVELIDSTAGLVSPDAVDTIEGVTYSVSEFGPMAWRFGATPEQVGLARMAPDIDPDILNASVLFRSIVIADPPRQRVLFCLPSAGSEVIDFVLAYNYRLQVFEGRWELFDIASAARMKDSGDREFVYFGGHYGKLFKLWASDVDGVRVSDGVSTFYTLQATVASASSTTTFTLPVSIGTPPASVDLDEANLPGMYVYLFDADDRTYQRRRIASVVNATKTITVASGFASDPPVGATVVIGAPVFEWDTKWQDNGDPFLMKRYFHTFISGVGNSNTSAYLDLFTGGTAVEPKRTWEFEASGAGAVFDEAQFDIAVFAEDAISTMKRRAATTGRNYRLRVRHFEPNRQFVLLALGMTPHTQNYKT